MSPRSPFSADWPRRRLLALALAWSTALAVAACGSTGSPTAAQPSGPPASPDASAAAASPSAAAASPSPTANVHAAPSLEARLPDSIGGVAMSKFSLTGADFLTGGSATGKVQLQSLLQQLGKTDGDLLVADTYDPTGASTTQAALFQVRGVDGVRLLALWVAAQKAATNDQMQVTSVTVDGRQLTRLEDLSADPSRVSYAWSSGDAVVIASGDESIAREVLAKIPP